MTAPTMPLGRDGLMQASTASAGSLPSMFAADLEGPAEPEIQKWEWTYENMLHRGSDAPPLHLKMADTVMLSPTTELTQWLFTSTKDGTVRKKNADKLTPQAVREAFEKAALMMAAFNRKGLTTIVRRSGSGASILDEAAMRDLTKDSGDLSGIVAMQLYIQGKGGNGTRYVCEYKRDRAACRVACTTHKLVYLGQPEGLSASIYGDTGDTTPTAYRVNCGMRALSEELGQSTMALCRRLEMHSKQTILHYEAQYILDENSVLWFIGGANIVTQKTPTPAAPKPIEQRHVPYSPTLQVRPQGKLFDAGCMGDYCSITLTEPVQQKKGKGGTGRKKKDEPDLTVGSLSPIEDGGGSFGDLVITKDGGVVPLADLLPKDERKRTLLPGLKFTTENDDEEVQGDGDASPQNPIPFGMEGAFDESGGYKGGPPSMRIAYRSILLDRTLRGMGIHHDDPAPPGVLQEFEAKVRRRLDTYYKLAHVCANCARWYERQSRRRAAELDALNSPLEPILKKTRTQAALLPAVMEAAGLVDEYCVDVSDSQAAITGPVSHAASMQSMRAQTKSLLEQLGATGSGVAPKSLERALMRTSTSLPALRKSGSAPPPIPMPAKRESSRRLGGVIGR